MTMHAGWTTSLACLAALGCSDHALQGRSHDMTTAKSSMVWGQPVAGLRLGLGTGATAGTVTIYLENTGTAPLQVLSHVAAQEKHLDWYTLQVQDGGRASRTLKLLGPRRESGKVQVPLAAGARIEHAVDVAAWAKRPINGGQPLAAGSYQVSAVYDVPAGADHWSGRLEAGPAPLTIP
jgi:hypothetical protein